MVQVEGLYFSVPDKLHFVLLSLLLKHLNGLGSGHSGLFKGQIPLDIILHNRGNLLELCRRYALSTLDAGEQPAA